MLMITNCRDLLLCLQQRRKQGRHIRVSIGDVVIDGVIHQNLQAKPIDASSGGQRAKRMPQRVSGVRQLLPAFFLDLRDMTARRRENPFLLSSGK